MTCAVSSNNAEGQLVLAINGADERLQLALGRLSEPEATDLPCVELLAAQEWTVPGQAIGFLIPGVQAILGGLGLAVRDVPSIACVNGPGSFTGVRMSLAAAQGLAAGSGALIAGINHLELLAHDAATLAEGAVLALTWSRRGQVYAQAYTAGQNDRVTTLCPPLALRLDELPEFIATLPRPLRLLGGGLRRNLPFFEELAATTPGILLLPRRFDAPRAETLLTLAAQATFLPAAAVEPVYLRASDAEDNLPAIAASRGLDLAEAQAILDRGSRTL